MEHDKAQLCNLAPNTVRTLLPHHDGGHCSFLTPFYPLNLENPRATWTLQNHNYTTTDMHKLYQGFFLKDAGDGLSITAHFDLIEILKDCFIFRFKKSPLLHQLMDWYGRSLDEFFAKNGTGGYIPIGVQLGCISCFGGIPIHHLDACFDVEGEIITAAYIFNEICLEALGIAAEEFMERYAILSPSSTGDLIVGHNIFSWHGGLMGGGNREIFPLCIATKSINQNYELWLKHNWRRFYEK